MTEELRSELQGLLKLICAIQTYPKQECSEHFIVKSVPIREDKWGDGCFSLLISVTGRAPLKVTDAARLPIRVLRKNDKDHIYEFRLDSHGVFSLQGIPFGEYSLELIAEEDFDGDFDDETLDRLAKWLESDEPAFPDEPLED